MSAVFNIVDATLETGPDTGVGNDGDSGHSHSHVKADKPSPSPKPEVHAKSEVPSRATIVCSVCGVEIPRTGKRGRPAKMHPVCKVKMQAEALLKLEQESKDKDNVERS